MSVGCMCCLVVVMFFWVSFVRYIYVYVVRVRDDYIVVFFSLFVCRSRVVLV